MNSTTDHSTTDNSTTDHLIKQMENSLHLTDSYKSQFYIEDTYEPDKKFFITKISLNFYQLWCIFGQIPFIHTKGKCKYEWIIRQENTNRIFSIYDWNNKNKLINTTQWYIRSNMPDDSSDFLQVLTDAIECYNLYYKQIYDETYTSYDTANQDQDETDMVEYLSFLETL